MAAIPTPTRALASANGLENPRFTGGAALEVGGGIQLNAAVGFVASASAGAGLGISSAVRESGYPGRRGWVSRRARELGVSASAGFGASASAGVGISAGAGFSAGAGASVGVGVFRPAPAVRFQLAAGGGALFGSSSVGGRAATAGAFAGLEVGRATLSTTAQLDPLRMLPATVGSDVAAGANASFGLGGVAMAPSGLFHECGRHIQF